jgi:hypothetical protein
MLLVRTDWPDFESYLASLSKPARKNYRYAIKLYGDKYPYREVLYKRDEVERFMKLWEKQLVRGQSIHWGYNVDSLQKHHRRNRLKVFSCGIAMQYIVKRGGYWDAEPVMYDKQYDYLATYMWFELFRYAITHRLATINLGGDGDWIETLKSRDENKHQYKYRYVPEKAKQDPDSEPPYYIKKRKLRLRSEFSIGAIFRRLIAKS